MLSINGPLYFLETTPGSTRDEIYPNTACLSGTAKLGDSAVKKCDPRERGRKLEYRAARSKRGGCFYLLFLLFFSIQYLPTERGTSAVDILGSSRH